MGSKHRALIATLFVGLVAGGVAAFITVRSREATAIAPERATAESKAPREVAELADAAPLAVDADVNEERIDVSAATPALGRAQPIDSAPQARFHGRVVYESTREPVPLCVVAARVAGKFGVLRATDEDGRFTVLLTNPDATLELFASDQTSLPYEWKGAQVVERAGASDAEVEIAVRMWPTIVFDTELPPGAERQNLTFKLPYRGELLGAMRTTRSRSKLWRYGASLGPGDAQELGFVLSNGPPWELEIDDSQHAWHCLLKLERFDGVVHVAPSWAQYGALDVKLGTNLSKRPQWTATLRVQRANSKTTAREMPDITADLGLGIHSLKKLEPGECVLQVTSDFCEPVEVPVTIRAGETSSVAVTLACPQPAGSIRGVVRSESGALKQVRVDAELWDAGGEIEHAEVDPFRWAQENGAWVARFAFRDVPNGDYSVVVRTGSEFALRPYRAVAVRPGSEVEFTVLDGAETIDVGFHVFEMSSGTELDGFDIETHRRQHDEQLHDLSSGKLALTGVPVDGDFSWTVSKSGYTCAWMNLTSASKNWTVDGRKRWVRVELDRGARVTVRVDDVNSKPLSGATILIDDRDAGRTDDQGRFSVLWNSTPKSVDVRYLNWRHSWRRMSRPVTTYFNPCWEIQFTLDPP